MSHATLFRAPKAARPAQRERCGGVTVLRAHRSELPLRALEVEAVPVGVVVLAQCLRAVERRAAHAAVEVTILSVGRGRWRFTGLGCCRIGHARGRHVSHERAARKVLGREGEEWDVVLASLRLRGVLDISRAGRGIRDSSRPRGYHRADAWRVHSKIIAPRGRHAADRLKDVRLAFNSADTARQTAQPSYTRALGRASCCAAYGSFLRASRPRTDTRGCAFSARRATPAGTSTTV